MEYSNKFQETKLKQNRTNETCTGAEKLDRWFASCNRDNFCDNLWFGMKSHEFEQKESMEFIKLINSVLGSRFFSNFL